jgi:hypothetical protein
MLVLRNNSMKSQLLILLMLVAMVICAAPAARACDGCGGGGWNWGYDMGYLYNSLDYNVPYFAAHPPVYYSYPVPRTYGYSPFAYPPYVMTPEVATAPAPAPVEIINPYVPSSQQEKARASADQSAAAQNRQPEPLVIINPYVSAKGTIAKAGK